MEAKERLEKEKHEESLKFEELEAKRLEEENRIVEELENGVKWMKKNYKTNYFQVCKE